MPGRYGWTRATASVRVAAAEQVGLAVGLGAGHVDVAVARSGDAAADPSCSCTVVAAARTAGVAVGITVPDAFAETHDHAPLLARLDALTALAPDQITAGRRSARGHAAQRSTAAPGRGHPHQAGAVWRSPSGDHAGFGLANALTAMKSGVRRFEATVGGVDGRVAVEDLLHLVDSLEVDSAGRPRRGCRAKRPGR